MQKGEENELLELASGYEQENCTNIGGWWEAGEARENQ